MGKNVKEQIERLLAERGSSVASREVAAAAQISRQAAHAHLRELAEAGRLVARGKGRATRYYAATGAQDFMYAREGLAEDRVWRQLRAEVGALADLRENVESILEYAATELLNNAIEHSSADRIEVRIGEEQGAIGLEVIDDGVGIFDHVASELGLSGRAEALQELSKGKVTTDPESHTGEGLFFTSRAVDEFEVESGGLRWVVLEEGAEMAMGTAPERKGTRVRVSIRRDATRKLVDVFAAYTDGFEFSRTRTVIKLFEWGTRFVSRSEARRLVRGLERFREVVLDFAGVELVGQGFVDEIFRVWARNNPGTSLDPVHMAPPIEFMVRRALHSDRES